MAAFVGGGTRTAQGATRCIVHSVRRSPRPTSRIGGVETTPLTAVRHKASAPFDEEYEGLKARRIQGIRPHPDGTTQHILPGNYVIKKNERTGREKRVFLEVRPESCCCRCRTVFEDRSADSIITITPNINTD